MPSFSSIDQLVSLLESANHAYREGKESYLSDAEYDQLEAQLRLLSPKHPLLTQVQDEGMVERPLTIAMGSQQKALSLPELSPWLSSMQEPSYFISHKLDGASVELTYVGGVLTQILTRGDGIHGTDISFIKEHCPNIPATIPELGTWVIRGEMMLSKAALIDLNEALSQVGRVPYKNTRNGAVALMKTQKNLPFVHFLSFLAFDLERVEEEF